jgi:flagellar protein FliS
MTQKALKAYAFATQTVAPTRQVVMLYDSAIRNLKQARLAIDSRDILGRYRALVKAGDIVFGLQGALDFEAGGDIAKTLYQFYSSIDARILSIHRTASVEMCDQVMQELKMMRDAWAEIDTDQNGSIVPAASEAPPVPLPHDPANGSAGVALSV